MKKALSISICMIALVAFAMWTPDASAFQFYSDATNDQGGCAQCHTGFRDNNNYISQAESVSWGTSLHNVHLNNTTIDISCDNCHGGVGTAGRTVNIGSSLNAADGVNAIACTGCHVPEGLRAHHAVNGVTLCAGCHSGDPSPQPENIAPPWYGSVINDIVGTNLEPCNMAGEEQLAGDTIGLDNDGDNAYDTADSDCLIPEGPTLEIPVQVPADAFATVTMPVTYIANGNAISSMIFSVDFDENNLTFDPASTMGFPWPDAIAVNPLISPFVFSVGITYDANDTDGELDFTFSDINLPLSALPEGDLVIITFTAGYPSVTTEAPVVFSLDPTASFGNTDGASVPGITIDGSVLLITCSIPTGIPETICNGIDDDCDGAIDEDYVPIPTTCGVGECAASGQTTCVNGVEGDTCIPGTPSFEVCDCSFLDENCDGLVDEICFCICDEIRPCGSDIGECLTGAETCVGGEWSGVCVGEVGPSNEVCDNLDNDCDGSIDENLTRPTTCGVGECLATGEETCTAGMWGADTCTPGPPDEPTDVTCDGLDGDCDGSTDEDYIPRPIICDPGNQCSAGNQTCQCVNGFEDCPICLPGPPEPEVCDNLDNDCDGSIDEDLTRPTTCGVGECAGNTGEETCVAGMWGGDTCDPFAGAVPEGTLGDPTCSDVLDNDCDGLTDNADPDCIDCTPTDEICDNIDNDCDGAVDENLTRPTTCGVGECTGNVGEETCIAGTWGNDTCDPLAGAVPEVCDCLDNDCDGVVDGGGCACYCGETRSCGSDVGECLTGTETCVDAVWSGVCVGEVGPSAEVCDDLDNDCDGSIDEDLTRPTTCGVGECAGNTGTETCTDGMWGSDTCDPFAGAVPEGPPGDPVCGDTLDNDCDGATDTGDSDCGVGVGLESDCFDGIDNNGDGLTDCEDPGCDGVSNGACSTANACTTGTRTCQGGAEVCAAINVPDGTACGDPSSTQCDNPDSCLAGTCVPNFEPLTTACDDGLFCRGGDTCNGAGVCAGDTSPCPPDLYCDEVNDVCVPLCPCITDADCDDGLFCNGFETCDGCYCNAGQNPCQPGEVCDENQNTCSEASLDLDIVKFTVSGSKDKRNKGKTKTGGSANVGKPIRRIQLVVENPDGGSEQGASATITGVQDGKEVYNETRMVWDLGTGKARFAFPNYTPVKKGTIQWTAEIFDNDPDNDTATATTRVK